VPTVAELRGIASSYMIGKVLSKKAVLEKDEGVREQKEGKKGVRLASVLDISYYLNRGVEWGTASKPRAAYVS